MLIVFNIVETTENAIWLFWNSASCWFIIKAIY